MNSYEMSKEELIKRVDVETPHVVILGAGASIASVIKGDKNGLRLPSMMNFVEILDLSKLLEDNGIESNRNFELIYSDLHNTNPDSKLIKEVESRVYDYFSKLELPDKPTIYDYLVLSLREKDVIATFNWDPFLLQAYIRNQHVAKLPKLLFLHGNVMLGICVKDKLKGVNGSICNKCGNTLTPSKLLYPVANKDYISDSFISNEWTTLKNVLHQACVVTIYGYGAPESDKSAIELMSEAWGKVSSRNMEQIEIIDIKPETKLVKSWKKFIHTHHYETHKDFMKSFIALYPRRTGEAYITQYFDAKFLESNPLPQKLNFNDLWKWFDELKKYE